jgi:hypothetical protein
VGRRAALEVRISFRDSDVTQGLARVGIGPGLPRAIRAAGALLLICYWNRAAYCPSGSARVLQTQEAHGAATPWVSSYLQVATRLREFAGNMSVSRFETVVPVVGVATRRCSGASVQPLWWGAHEHGLAHGLARPSRNSTTSPRRDSWGIESPRSHRRTASRPTPNWAPSSSWLRRS